MTIPSLLPLLGGTLLAVLLFIVCFNHTVRSDIGSFLKKWLWVFLLPAFIFMLAANLFGMQAALNGIPIAINILIQALVMIFMMGLQFWAMMYFMSRGRVYWVMPGEMPLSWDDYKGNPQVKEMAQTIVAMLKSSSNPKMRETGVQAIRGLLLSGPPGTGKSYLAQVMAAECGIPFAYCSAPSLQSAFMGMSAMTIWRLYKNANKYAADPRYGAAIIFMDEIDAIGQSRNGQPGQLGSGMISFGGGTQILNELLTQMDPPPVITGWWQKTKRWWLYKLCFRSQPKVQRQAVLTIGATNLVETLDAALLRPGRFDIQLTVDLPDATGLKELIEYYLKKVSNELNSSDVERVVHSFAGHSPATVKLVTNMAIINALNMGRKAANLGDVLKSLNFHETGFPEPILGMSEEEKRRVAYHEAGHAVLCVLDAPHKLVQTATIIRHKRALGFVRFKDKEERHTGTWDETLRFVDLAVASRVVEEEILGIQMDGFSGDLQMATRAVVSAVSTVGMGKRLISYAALGLSTSPEVVNQAALVIEGRFKLVRKFIADNEKAVHAIAQELLAHGTVDGPDVIRIINENAGKKLELGQTLVDLYPEVLNEDELSLMASRWDETKATKPLSSQTKNEASNQN